ncbi:MAG: sigma-70 family RNA polymerase sigma factor [Polyangiaceae bacterium]
MTTPSTETLSRAQAGDPAAMERLLAEVAPVVQRFGLRLCGASADADDVLQDTLLTVATHVAEFEGRASFSSWLFALVRSACTRRRRGLKNQPPVDSEAMVEMPDLAASPEDLASAEELRVALGRGLASLPYEQREAVLLRDVEGLTAPEAAEAIGISVEALKSRLHRGRSALRAALRSTLEPRSTPRPSCPDVALLWSRKLEGELGAGDCAEMERHLVGCPSCRAACDGLRETLAMCKREGSATATTEAGKVSPAIQAQVKAAMRAWIAGQSPDLERQPS